MAEFTKLIMTETGRALYAKNLAGEADIQFTSIRTSTDTFTESELNELTELPDIVQTKEIDSINVIDTTEVCLTVEFTNAEVSAEYVLGSVGLYATDPDGGELLYAVASETSGRCYMTPYNGESMSKMFFEMIAEVGNADSVTIMEYETGYALKSETLDVNYDGDNHSMVFTKGIR